jgi:hypothetical protein
MTVYESIAAIGDLPSWYIPIGIVVYAGFVTVFS